MDQRDQGQFVSWKAVIAAFILSFVVALLPFLFLTAIEAHHGFRWLAALGTFGFSLDVCFNGRNS